jgi:hypothetical protein
MKKIALVLSIIVLFCGYHANAQITGSNLLFGGLDHQTIIFNAS